MLRANIVVKFVDYILRARQVEPFVSVFYEKEYAVPKVKFNKVRRFKVLSVLPFATRLFLKQSFKRMLKNQPTLRQIYPYLR